MDTTAVALKEASTRRKEYREQTKQRMKQLLAADMSRAEIMERLSISSGHYYRLLAELKES